MVLLHFILQLNKLTFFIFVRNPSFNATLIHPSMVRTCGSRIPPSPNIDKVIVSFDKLNNTDFFPSKTLGLYSPQQADAKSIPSYSSDLHFLVIFGYKSQKQDGWLNFTFLQITSYIKSMYLPEIQFWSIFYNSIFYGAVV